MACVSKLRSLIVLLLMVVLSVGWIVVHTNLKNSDDLEMYAGEGIGKN